MVYKDMRIDNIICIILYLILFAQLITEPANRRIGKSKGYRYYMFRAIISSINNYIACFDRGCRRSCCLYFTKGHGENNIHYELSGMVG